MREQLKRRVGELRAEQQKGQQVLAELEAKQAELRQTLMRISGAIQVLEELLAGQAQQDGLVPAAAGSPATGL